MKQVLHAVVFVLLFSVTAQAQLISKFTWEGTDPSKSDVGPNATSISTSAVISTGGAAGKGLSAGSGNHDINLVLDGSYFKLPGLDISVDFRRKESDASFFKLGNFDFGMAGGALYAKFALVKGTGDTTINATNLYTIPSDNLFHTYRFVYNASTGKATVQVDGVVVYTFQRTASTALSWTGAGNATIGTLMDGTGNNVAILDNLIISNPAGNSTLPLQLLSFGAKKTDAAVGLDWSTTHEFNTRNFIIQRSEDGVDFQTIGSVISKDGLSGTNVYHFTDSIASGVNYYRLKMVDIDGAYTYSEVRIAGTAVAAAISVYPNPCVEQVNIRIDGDASAYGYAVMTMDGRTLQAGVTNGSQQVSLNLSAAPKGMLVVRMQNSKDHRVETFKLLKK
jgi:hypothetical protein